MALTKKQSEAVERIRKGLKCSETEAIEIMLADEAVDKMKMSAVDDDLSADAKKTAKEMRSTGTKKKPTQAVYKFDKKERKPNLPKAELIAKLAEYLAECAENVTVTNKERQISFSMGENSFELTLVQKRKPKQ